MIESQVLCALPFDPYWEGFDCEPNAARQSTVGVCGSPLALDGAISSRRNKTHRKQTELYGKSYPATAREGRTIILYQA